MMIAMPLAREWFDLARRHGLAVTDSEPAGPAAPAMIEKVLRSLDWPFHSGGDADHWWAQPASRDGRWPPFAEVGLNGDGTTTFPRGPAFGSWEITRLVDSAAGRRLAFDAATSTYLIIGPYTGYDEFCLTLNGAPPRADGLDRQWVVPGHDDGPPAPGPVDKRPLFEIGGTSNRKGLNAERRRCGQRAVTTAAGIRSPAGLAGAPLSLWNPVDTIVHPLVHHNGGIPSPGTKTTNQSFVGGIFRTVAESSCRSPVSIACPEERIR